MSNSEHACACAAPAKLAEIEMAIREYYAALSARQHGGVAQDRAIKRIEEILGMKWEG